MPFSKLRRLYRIRIRGLHAGEWALPSAANAPLPSYGATEIITTAGNAARVYVKLSAGDSAVLDSALKRRRRSLVWGVGRPSAALATRSGSRDKGRRG